MKPLTPEDRKKAESAEHDRAVRELSDTALLIGARDLGKPGRKKCEDWMERNWTMGRLAAHGREIVRRGLNRQQPQHAAA